jgi:hypothetical protein
VAQQVQRIIEWRNCTDYADGNVGNSRLAIRATRGDRTVQNFAIEKGGRVTRKPQRIYCAPRFVSRFAYRLSHLTAYQIGQVFLVILDHVGQRIQQCASFCRRAVTKFSHCCDGTLHGCRDVTA